MTTPRLLSSVSLRALAASRRQRNLTGGTWSAVGDRDLDRISADLLLLSQADPGPRLDASSRALMPPPVKLHDRLVRGGVPRRTAPTGSHVRAS